MLVKTRHSAGAFLLAALLPFSGCQRSRTTPFAARFAVELPSQSAFTGALPREEYLMVPDHGLTSTELPGDSLRPLPDSAGRNGPPITLKLDFTVDRNRVIATIYTLPPESDPLRYNDGHKRRLGIYSARLNETVELKELGQLGYQPLTLRIVTAKPDRPIRPNIISKVRSIQLRVAEEDRNGYTLLLRNASPRGVLSYVISEGDGVSLTSNSRRQSLIAAGAERHQRIEPASRDVAVVAALFSDGSYEGEPYAAAQLKSGQIGYEAQERRAIPIIDRIIRNSGLNDEGKVARIKDELSRLSNEPDDTTIRTMQTQFPVMSADIIRQDLTSALYLARVNIWSEVYGYVHTSGEYPPPVHPPPMSEWLRHRQ
jgi:hypothetical protein